MERRQGTWKNVAREGMEIGSEIEMMLRRNRILTILDGFLKFAEESFVYFVHGGLEIVPHSLVDFRFEDLEFSQSLK